MGHQPRHPDPEPARPDLTLALTEDEFRRWYWTLAELQSFARSVGVSASGRKADVTDRLAATLGGRAQPRATRRSTTDGITEPLTPDTMIPPNQRSTGQLRHYFEDAIGPSFRFNGHMRALLADGGVTLADAVDHWYATLGTELPTQSESLEFNRFTKAWHRANPDGSPGAARAAWARYRALPSDQRPPIAEA
ncbi:MAG: DUF6434 domain-containing protein [Actinomycetota bacterium]